MKSAMMAKPADKNIQSGNSRVKVTIYGQVNRAVRYASSGGKNDIHSVDNSESNSRLGVRAVGKLNAGTTAVAWSEWAMAAGGGRSTGFSDDGSQDKGGNLSMRHSVVDISHKDMGTLSLGHSTRADASAIFAGFQGAGIAFHGGGPGNIDSVVPQSDMDGVADDKIAGGRIGVPTNVYPSRENRILVRSPNLMGASLAASYNQAKSWSVGGSFKSPASLSKEVSVALGFGYRSQPGDTKMNTIGVSGGVQHNPSGLSVNGVWAQKSVKGGDRHSGWAADVSWTGKVADFGSTSFTAGYGQYRDGSHKQTKGYWVALNQRVDSAAADVYFGASYDTGRGAYSTANMIGTDASGDDTDYNDADATDGTAAVLDNTCSTQTVNAGDATMLDGTEAMCSVDRKAVLVFLAGIRVKF